jgi:hypothetical protein
MSKEHVLVVARTDELAVRLTVSLLDAGYGVRLARSPQEALAELVIVPNFAAVVLEDDLMLPRAVLGAMAGDQDLMIIPAILVGGETGKLPAGVWAQVEPATAHSQIPGILSRLSIPDAA